MKSFNKKKQFSKKFINFYSLIVLLACIISGVPWLPAHAGFWDKVKSTTKKVTHKAKKITKKAGDATKKTAKKVGDTTKKTAKKVGDATKKTAKKGWNATKDTSKKASNATKGAVTTAWNATKNTSHKIIKETVRKYNDVKNTLNKLKNKALELLFKKSANVFVKKNKKFIKKLYDNMHNLDKQGLQARDEILQALAKQKTHFVLTPKLRKNMGILGEKLGLIKERANCIIPRRMRKSCFGIYLAAGGAAIASGEGMFAIAMNTFRKGKSYPVALITGLNAGIGAQVGGSLQAGIFWSPGDINSCAGADVGASMEAAVGPVGAAIGLSWSVDKNMFKIAARAIPGFSLAWAAGVEAKAFAITAGYSKLLKKF